MNNVDTTNTYPLVVQRPQLPSRVRLYVSCILLSALSALPLIALLMYKDLIPAPYMTAWNWLMVALATYSVIAGIFQLRIKANPIDRLLCAVLSYLVWTATASTGGSMAVGTDMVDNFAVYFLGIKTVWYGMVLPLYLFGPVSVIAIARCWIGPQPQQKTAILGCGQHKQIEVTHTTAAPATEAQPQHCPCETSLPHR